MLCSELYKKVYKNRINHIAQRAGRASARDRGSGVAGDSGGVCRVIASAAAAPSQHIKRNYRKSIEKYDNKANNNSGSNGSRSNNNNKSNNAVKIARALKPLLPALAGGRRC